MTAAEILALAKARNVKIRLDGNDLDIVAECEPGPNLLAAIAGCKPELLAAHRIEQGRINHWIAARIVNDPTDRCPRCRKPIVAGQASIEVTNGEVTPRFHQSCHADWLVEQEAAARRALGIQK